MSVRDDYTPSTDDVRDSYADNMTTRAVDLTWDAAEAEFDAWLDRVKADARAEVIAAVREATANAEPGEGSRNAKLAVAGVVAGFEDYPTCDDSAPGCACPDTRED